MSLRFAMVCTFYPPYHFGGDAIAIQRLSAALRRRGHHVEVIHDADSYRLLETDGNQEPAPTNDDITTHALSSPFGALGPLLTQQTGRPLLRRRRLQALLAGGDFDVTHFHNVSLVGGPAAFELGRGIRIYTAHEHWLVCPTSTLWRHNRELCTGRQCLRCQIHHHRPPQLWRSTGLLERSLPQIDAFISPSRFSADLHRQFGFSREMEVIPYFLPRIESDLERGEPHPADRERNGPYFLFVGRLEKIKGIQDLIRHFPADSPYELLVAGQGSYGETLRSLADGSRVRFLGSRTQEQLRWLYRDAMALLVPSLCYETFGLVLLEAFREATPVLCRRRGPFPEIVEASGGGLLFDSDADLGEALSRLAGSEELRRSLGASGQRALRDRWSEDAVIGTYLQLIERLAEQRQTGSVAPGRIA